MITHICTYKEVTLISWFTFGFLLAFFKLPASDMQFWESSLLIISCLLIRFGHSARELARGKNTSASILHAPRWNSSNVVDGETNTNVFCDSCLMTKANGESNAWWQVDLGGVYRITKVEMYSREPYLDRVCPSAGYNYPRYTLESDRFKGYSIFISNTSDWTTGDRCYKEPSGPGEYPDLYQNNSCVGYGSYLTIYTDHRATYNSPNDGQYSGACLSICEVKVYGCGNGFYGNNCTELCPQHCMGNTCDPDTGFCFECEDGWLGEICNEPCADNLYGRNCSQVCGNCMDASCINTNGTCIGGCSEGWIGAKCDRVCPLHFYGQDCNRSCRECRNDESCIHTNGSCPMGCKVGYSGHRCDRYCPEGTFGVNCIETCGNCKGGDTCHHITGECTEGCSDGWLGRHCNSRCPLHTYGRDCNISCGLCRNNEPCVHTNGSCTNGCVDGIAGDQCKSRCQVGTYGTNCDGVCGNCMNASDCHHVTGLCLSRVCQAGWMGSDCKSGVEGSSNSRHNNGVVTILSVAVAFLTLAFGFVLIFLIILLRKLPSDQVKKIKKQCFSISREPKCKNDSVYETTSTRASQINETDEMHVYQTLGIRTNQME